MKTIKFPVKKYPIPNKTNTEIDYLNCIFDSLLYNMVSTLTYLLVYIYGVQKTHKYLVLGIHKLFRLSKGVLLHIHDIVTPFR